MNSRFIATKNEILIRKDLFENNVGFIESNLELILKFGKHKIFFFKINYDVRKQTIFV